MEGDKSRKDILLMSGKRMSFYFLFFIFMWLDLEMSAKVKVVINELKWENKILKMDIKDMQEVKGRNGEEIDEVKEFQQHNTLEARDWLGTDEVEELKRELKELKASFKLNQFSLKCNALFCVFL